MVVDSKQNEGTNAGVFIQHGMEEIPSSWVTLVSRS